ncbi:MAG: CAP domain-containing protein [Caldilineaceae bacterium]
MVCNQKQLHWWVGLTLLSGLVMLLPWAPVWAEGNFSGCGGATVAVSNADYEARIAELVNQRRAEHGLPPLKLITELSNAARYHATDMMQDDYFDHQTQDRVNGALVAVCAWSARVQGYYSNYRTLGENIAWGYDSPESVMEGWMNSDGHRANILGNFQELGVGYQNSYWVQDFGARTTNAPVIIQGEARQTASPNVSVYIHGNWQQMRLRNDDDSWGEWQTFHHDVAWTLRNVNGERHVDVEVRSGSNVVAGNDSIVLTASATPEATPAPLTESLYLPLVQK